MPVTSQHARWRIDNGDARVFEREQALGRDRPLAHVQHQVRVGELIQFEARLVRALDRPSERLQLRDGGIENGGIVRPVLIRRVRRLTVQRDELPH
jgi:hypothetical protein